MNVHLVESTLKARGWSKAELARRVGVSRQAVSLWFKAENASVRSGHLLKVSAVLGVRAEVLANPLPGFGADHDQLLATFLWDRLYPDLDDFAIAVGAWELPAVARFVQVAGLYASERVLGPSVWHRFETYQRYLHPVRGKELRRLVEWHRTRTTS